MSSNSNNNNSYRDAALDLLLSWDRQQTAYIRHRDLRFAAIVTSVVGQCGEAPRILDIACGPGSLSIALRKALPKAQIVGCDKDPILLKIAYEAFADDPLTEIVTLDLDDANNVCNLPGEFDAAVSSTALHWLQPGKLAELYFALATKIRPGGVFLNGDHFLYDSRSQATLRRLAADDDKAQQETAFYAGADDWEGWWKRAAAAPGFENVAAAREIVWKNRLSPAPKLSIGHHQEVLRSAGFSEVGSVWQYFDDWVVAAIR